MEEELFYTLALTFVPNLGTKRQHDDLKRFGSAQAFFMTAERQRQLIIGTADSLTLAQRRAEKE